MTFKFVARLTMLLASSWMLLVAPAVASESWPTRPVTIVVPFSAGGSQDVIARMLAKHLEAAFKNPFVVENRLGAGGNIATAFVAKSNPDGYTFVLSSSGPLANNRFLYKNLGYDPTTDLTPISLLGQFPMVIAANKSAPFTDLQSYVRAAAAKPDAFAIGTPGAGTMGDLTALLLQSVTGTKLLHVPFSGGAPALMATVSGQIPMAVDVVNATLAEFLKSGQLSGLAITSSKRFPGLPDLPTAVEQGFPKLVSGVHFALVGPAKLPLEIVEKLNAEINRFLSLPATRAQLGGLGAEIAGGPPDEVTKMMKEAAAVWEPIIKASGAAPR